MFARFSVLLLAAVLASPALWHAFVAGDLDIPTALIRYLIAVLVAAMMLALLRMLFRAYHHHNAQHHSRGHPSDEAAAPSPEHQGMP